MIWLDFLNLTTENEQIGPLISGTWRIHDRIKKYGEWEERIIKNFSVKCFCHYARRSASSRRSRTKDSLSAMTKKNRINLFNTWSPLHHCHTHIVKGFHHIILLDNGDYKGWGNRKITNICKILSLPRQGNTITYSRWCASRKPVHREAFQLLPMTLMS